MPSVTPLRDLIYYSAYDSGRSAKTEANDSLIMIVYDSFDTLSLMGCKISLSSIAILNVTIISKVSGFISEPFRLCDKHGTFCGTLLASYSSLIYNYHLMGSILRARSLAI